MTSSQEWHHIDRKQANILVLAQILRINQIAGSLPGRKLLVESFLLNTTFPITIQILENERKYSQSRKILTIFFLGIPANSHNFFTEISANSHNFHPGRTGRVRHLLTPYCALLCKERTAGGWQRHRAGG